MTARLKSVVFPRESEDPFPALLLYSHSPFADKSRLSRRLMLLARAGYPFFFLWCVRAEERRGPYAKWRGEKGTTTTRTRTKTTRCENFSELPPLRCSLGREKIGSCSSPSSSKENYSLRADAIERARERPLQNIPEEQWRSARNVPIPSPPVPARVNMEMVSRREVTHNGIRRVTPFPTSTEQKRG